MKLSVVAFSYAHLLRALINLERREIIAKVHGETRNRDILKITWACFGADKIIFREYSAATLLSLSLKTHKKKASDGEEGQPVIFWCNRWYKSVYYKLSYCWHLRLRFEIHSSAAVSPESYKIHTSFAVGRWTRIGGFDKNCSRNTRSFTWIWFHLSIYRRVLRNTPTWW